MKILSSYCTKFYVEENRASRCLLSLSEWFYFGTHLAPYFCQSVATIRLWNC